MTMDGESRKTLRRWRPHGVAILAALAALALLGLLNLPGQLVTETQRGGISSQGHRFEHGWPLVYLVRDHAPTTSGRNFLSSTSVPAPSAAPTQRDVWILRAPLAMVRWPALIVNFALALGVVALVGSLVEWRARSSRRIWQITLAELLILMTVLGPIFGWAHHQRLLWKREQAALEQLGNVQFETTLGGPTWLRLLVGDRPFVWLDRVRGLSTSNADMAAIGELTRLKTLRLNREVPEGDLALMGRCRSLESLILKGYDPYNNPAASRLRMRTLFAAISQIRTLQHLEIPYAYIDNECLASLGNLQRLTSLDLTGADLDDAALEPIGRLSQLETLDLSWAALDGSGLHHLERLPRLTSVRILQKGVPPESFIKSVTQLQQSLPSAAIQY